MIVLLIMIFISLIGVLVKLNYIYECLNGIRRKE